MNILFVCTGNVSRSFLAEMLLENEIRALQAGGIEVSSSGLHAYPGSPPDPNMVNFLLKRGIAVKPHESKQVTDEHVEWADLIVVMEKYHIERMMQSWPEAFKKVTLLSQFAYQGRHEDDIPDPFGRSTYHYLLAQSQITLAVKSLAKKIISEAGEGTPK